MPGFPHPGPLPAGDGDKERRRRIFKVTACLLALCLSAASAADPAPLPAHRAEYLLTRDGLPFADMVMELQPDPDGGYAYRAETKPHKAIELMLSLSGDIGAGARVEELSSGRVVAGRFRPDQYRHRRDGDAQRTLDVRFDWGAVRAAMASADRPWTMKIPPDTQDKLSVLLALRTDLAAGADELSYPVADGGRLKTYRYTRERPDEVAIGQAAWSSITLTRVKDKGEIDYRLWLAPALAYLPVRVERTANGVHYRMELIAHQLGPARPPAAEPESAR